MPGRPPARLSTCQAVKGSLGPGDPCLGTPTPGAPTEASRPRSRPLCTYAWKGSRGVAEVVLPGGRAGGALGGSNAGAGEQRVLSRAVVWQHNASRQPPAALSHLPAAAAVMLLQLQPILFSDFPIVRLSSTESDLEWTLIPVGRVRHKG